MVRGRRAVGRRSARGDVGAAGAVIPRGRGPDVRVVAAGQRRAATRVGDVFVVVVGTPPEEARGTLVGTVPTTPPPLAVAEVAPLRLAPPRALAAPDSGVVVATHRLDGADEPLVAQPVLARLHRAEVLAERPTLEAPLEATLRLLLLDAETLAASAAALAAHLGREHEGGAPGRGLERRRRGGVGASRVEFKISASTASRDVVRPSRKGSAVRKIRKIREHRAASVHRERLRRKRLVRRGRARAARRLPSDVSPPRLVVVLEKRQPALANAHGDLRVAGVPRGTTAEGWSLRRSARRRRPRRERRATTALVRGGGGRRRRRTSAGGRR